MSGSGLCHHGEGTDPQTHEPSPSTDRGSCRSRSSAPPLLLLWSRGRARETPAGLVVLEASVFHHPGAACPQCTDRSRVRLPRLCAEMPLCVTH